MCETAIAKGTDIAKGTERRMKNQKLVAEGL